MKILGSLVTAILLLCFTSVHARENSKSSFDLTNFEKIYIQLDQLEIDSEGIYIDIEGNVFRTPGLFHDAQGLYVLRKPWTSYCENGHPSPDGYHCYNITCRFYKAPDVNYK